MVIYGRWNSLPSDLRHDTHHVTPSILNSPVYDILSSLFRHYVTEKCVRLLKVKYIFNLYSGSQSILPV